VEKGILMRPPRYSINVTLHPRLAGHGPTWFAALSKHVDLLLVGRLEFGSGAVVLQYESKKGKADQ
jgi:hypothetical protein